MNNLPTTITVQAIEETILPSPNNSETENNKRWILLLLLLFICSVVGTVAILLLPDLQFSFTTRQGCSSSTGSLCKLQAVANSNNFITAVTTRNQIATKLKSETETESTKSANPCSTSEKQCDCSYDAVMDAGPGKGECFAIHKQDFSLYYSVHSYINFADWYASACIIV